MGHGFPRISHISGLTLARVIGLTISTLRFPILGRLLTSLRYFHPGINYYTNGAGHQYHSFTGEVERRFAQGLSAPRIVDVGTRYRRPERGESLRSENANVLSIKGHCPDAPAQFQLDLPVAVRKGQTISDQRRPWIESSPGGGWEISGVYSYYSGQKSLTPLGACGPTGTANSQPAAPLPMSFSGRRHGRNSRLQNTCVVDPVAILAPVSNDVMRYPNSINRDVERTTVVSTVTSSS